MGRSAWTVNADLADRDALDAMASEVERAGAGAVDILVNNGGRRSRDIRPTKFPVEDWDRVLRTNLDAVWLLSQRFGAQMIARRSGKIINVASLLSFSGGDHRARVHGEQARDRRSHQGARQRVGVAQRAGQRDRAGLLRRPTTRRSFATNEARVAQINARIPAGRWGDPADLAGAVVFLASDASQLRQRSRPRRGRRLDGSLRNAMHRLPDPERTRTLSADDLRAAFLVRGLFTAGRVTTAPRRSRSRDSRRGGAARRNASVGSAGVARRRALSRATRDGRAEHRRPGRRSRGGHELRASAARRALPRSRHARRVVQQRERGAAGALLSGELSGARVASVRANSARRCRCVGPRRRDGREQAPAGEVHPSRPRAERRSS